MHPEPTHASHRTSLQLRTAHFAFSLHHSFSLPHTHPRTTPHPLITTSEPRGFALRYRIIRISASQLRPWHISAHIYCTICQCRHRETLGRVDHHNWELWDNEKIHQHAEEWRDAMTVKDRVSIFDKHSTHYSELWHLPYWNPTYQLVVDPMHALFEGLFSVHFRNILKLTSANAKIGFIRNKHHHVSHA